MYFDFIYTHVKFFKYKVDLRVFYAILQALLVIIVFILRLSKKQLIQRRDSI